jgi:hypothetical protein
MPLSKSDAADALRTIEGTERLSGTLRGYAAAAPYFLIWGLAWAAGYGLTAAQPDKRTLIWASAVGVGTLLSILAGMRGGGVSGRKPSLGYSLVIAGAIAGFIGVTTVVLGPMQPRQVDALVPLLTAGLYVFGGIWGGARIGLAGLALAAVTVIGFFVAGDAFGYWMAAAGGGLLLLTGLWLRTV